MRSAAVTKIGRCARGFGAGLLLSVAGWSPGSPAATPASASRLPSPPLPVESTSPQGVPYLAANDNRRVPADALDLQLSLAPAVRRAAPAVVNIYARRLVQERVSPFEAHPFFREFFRNFNSGPRRQRLQNALGSGVLVGTDGIVVTAEHVISGALEIRVVLADRREYAAEILLADVASDLAVLRLEGAQDLPVVEIRDADELEVGDIVLAIGNPLGVGQTVTSGIVSALARSGGKGRHFVQTDAAINVGNSGGALIDSSGRLVGINTAIVTRSGGSDGIGFAVPSNLAARALEDARAGARSLSYPWTGFEGQEVTQDLADALGLDRPRGVILGVIDARSGFAEAGLQTGDAILALDGKEVNSFHEIKYRLAVAGLGRVVELVYFRDGTRRTTGVTLASAPAEPAAEPYRFGGRAGPFAGAEIANANPALAEEMAVPSVNITGVVVTDAGRDSARRWLRPGDFVRRVNGIEIVDVYMLRSVIQANRRDWNVTIERGGRRLSASFR